MASSSQVVGNLKAAIRDLEAKRDAEIEAVRRRFELQIGSINNTISLLNGEEPVDMDRAEVHDLSISDERLAMIREYIHKRPKGVRQADIAPAIKINSGSVSVGVRVLRAQGVIEPGNSNDGSRLWLPAKVTADAVA